MTRLAFSFDELGQYQLQQSVTDFAAEMVAYKRASDHAYLDLAGYLSTQQYGATPEECADIFAAKKPNSPLFLFIHGGYWRMLSRKDSFMMAKNLHAIGAAVMSIDYGLAPAFSLSQMIDQCAQALAWIRKNAHRFNVNPDLIHISGSSAGAHLAAMLLGKDAQKPKGKRQIHSASLISGLMDLAPLIHTPVNQWLKLDSHQAALYSPVLHLPAEGVPVLISWGEQEPKVMHDQSRHFASQCEQAGCQVTSFLVPKCNHFNILMEFEDPNSGLSRTVFEMMRTMKGDSNV